MLFSIVVPVYKVEPYLRECVESILDQSFTDYELILVDDGSPDRCPAICNEYANLDNRIRVIHQRNAGIACARNAGIKIAKGEYVICIDSDDYLANSDVLSHIAEKTAKVGDVVLYGFRKLFESDHSFGSDVVPIISGEVDLETMLTIVLSSNTYCGTAWTKAVRLSVLRDNGIEFRPGMISEDIDWYLHLMCFAKTYVSTNEAAIIYRQRSGSISHAAKLNSLTDNLWILDNWPKGIKELVPDKKTVNALYKVLAYYCANDLILYSGYPSNVSRPYKQQLKDACWLLDYAVTPRAKLVRKFFRILGFDITVVALKILAKLKKRQ